MADNLIIQLIAKLNKALSKKQIQTDIKEVEKTPFYVRMIARLNKGLTRRNIESDVQKATKNISVDINAHVSERKMQQSFDMARQNLENRIQNNPLDIPVNIDAESVQQIQKLNDQMKNTKNLLGDYLTAREIFNAVTKAIKGAVEEIKALNKAQTDLQIATSKSAVEMKSLMADYNQLAKDMSSTTLDIVGAADDFLRQGQSVANTNTLIKDSLMLSKIGQIESEESTKYLTSAMKGYQIEAENVISIVDKLSATDMAAAVSAGGLAESMSKCANSASTAGVSMDSLIGYIATVAEVTQKSDSVIGESFKTIMARIGKIKLNDWIDDDGTDISGEINDVEKTLGKFNIALRKNATEFRDFEDVIYDVGMAWDKFSSVDKNAIANAFGGVYQRENVLTLFNNFSRALELTEVSANSAGTAMEKFYIYENSLEAATNRLTASLEGLAYNTIDSKFLTGLANATAGIVEFVDSTKLIQTGLTAMLFTGAISGLVALGTKMIAVRNNIIQFTQAMNLSRNITAVAGLQYEALLNSVRGLSEAQLRLVLSSRQLTEAQRLELMQEAGIEQARQRQLLQTWNLTNATNAQITATFSLRGAWEGLKASIASNPIGLIVTALTLATTAINTYKRNQEEAAQAAEEAREKAVENAEAYKDEASSLKELQSRYTELIASTNDITTIKEDLSSIQDELINKYGDEAEAIDVVNGKYADVLANMQAISKQKAEDFIFDNSVEYEKQKKRMSTSAEIRTRRLADGGWIQEADDNAIVIELDKDELTENIMKKWRDAGIDNIQFLSAGMNGSVTTATNQVVITGMPQEQFESLKLATELYKEYDSYNEKTAQKMIDSAKTVRESIDAFELLDKEMKSAEKTSNNIRGKTADEIKESNKEFNELLNKAVEAYNTLNTSNSPAARGEAYEELKSLETALKNIAGNNTDLQQIVTDTFNSFKLGADNTNTSLTTLSKTFSDYLDNDFKSATDNIGKIQDAIMNVAKGDLIDNEDFWELFNLDENNLIGIPKIIDGKFEVAIENLIALKDELINKLKEQIKLDQKEARLAINNAYKNLSIEERKLNDLRSKVNSTGDIQALKAQEQVVQEIKDSISGYREIISKDNWLIQVLNSNLGYTKEIVDSLTESLQEQADNLLKAQENQIDKIVQKLNDEKSAIEDSKKELEEQLKVLEEQKDEIEEIISNYEKVSDIVSETIQSEIDSLEESRQSVEDYYDEMINKLQEANDERQESINLAEKLAALENAKNNKVRVFDETRGWTYEADKSAIESAQEDLLNAQNEAEISRLEKEKKAALADYDAQIKPLQEYEKQWSDSLKGITDAENEALAEQILGADWREKIKARDTEILTQFQNNYGTYKTRLHNLVSGEIADLNNSIKAKDNEIEAKERQIESWQKYKTEIQNAAEEINGAFKDYTDGLNKVALSEKSSYEDRINNLGDFVSQYAEKINKINELKDSINISSDNEEINNLIDQLSFINEYMVGIQEISKRLNESPTGFGQGSSAGDAKLIQAARLAELLGLIKGSNANGGVVDYTGLSQMHGTKTASETVFNARDSKKLYDLVHGSDSLIDMFRDKIDKAVYQHNANTTNNKTTNIYATFGDIVSNNPEAFAKFMKDYLERVKSESDIF